MCKKTNFPNRELLAKQSDIAYSLFVVEERVVLVDCGSCGATSFQHYCTPEGDISENYVCPFCGFEGDPSDFPDHFYEGFEQSAEFDNP